jgi:hypothetical protein
MDIVNLYNYVLLGLGMVSFVSLVAFAVYTFLSKEERARFWAAEAIAGAYNVAIDHLKMTGELPSGAERKEIALAYYDTIPSHHRKFSREEFADAIDVAFTFIDAGASLVARK